MAGDGVGLSNLTALQNLCAGFPENKFLVTVLARENQHELCVLARKFRNLHIFGCWWFTNVPYLVEEITRLRIELLGLSFTPQHSDARVLDQIVYKWQHSRRIIAQVLVDKYSALAETGWQVTRAEIERDVKDLFGAYGIDRCDLLKMDCEGSELPILRAAPPEMLAKIGAIIMEYHDPAEVEPLTRLLSGAGFRCEVLAEIKTLYANRR